MTVLSLNSSGVNEADHDGHLMSLSDDLCAIDPLNV